jgi:AraC-like DNA-binding protein
MDNETRAGHGSPSGSPLHFLQLNGWTEPFPRHWHDEWGIAVINEGVNRFWYRGGWHEAPAGSIIVVPPGEIHDGGLARAPWSERMAYVPIDAMAGIARACGSREDPTFRQPIIDDPSLCSSLLRLHSALADCSRDGLERDELQVRVIGALLIRHGSVAEAEPRRGESRAIQRAKAFLRERATTQIHLTDIAETAGLPSFQLIRQFKKEVGITPYAYLKQLRITIAQRLLRSGVSPARAAFSAGFSDQSHLTRELRKTTGITPGLFRDGHSYVAGRRST